jgi:hypothetical protein
VKRASPNRYGITQGELHSNGAGLIFRKRLDEKRTITQPEGILNFATNQVETLFYIKGVDISHRFLSVL